MPFKSSGKESERFAQKNRDKKPKTGKSRFHNTFQDRGSVAHTKENIVLMVNLL